MNQHELETTLTESGIDLALWGTGSAKTIRHLMKEIDAGETTMEVVDGRLVRKVRVLHAEVYVERGDRRLHLREDRQEFADGRTRRRTDLTNSVSEKMEPGETPAQALARGLREELGIAEGNYFICRDFTSALQDKESASYPGLATKFEKHFVSVEIDGALFREEFVEVQEDKTTYFRWEEVAR